MPNSELGEKVVLVTGANRSLGRSFAEACCRAGATVVLSDVEPGAALDPRLGKSTWLPLDVTVPEDWDAAIAQTIEKFGRLDALVNNAAVYFGRVSLWEQDPEDFSRMLDVNVRGVWLGTRAASRAMAANGGGSIVNLSSTSGLMGAQEFSGYGTTRWAVRGFTKHAAIELAPYGIRVNSLHPGGIRDTGMYPPIKDDADEKARALAVPLGRIGNREDVAGTLVFLLSEAASYMTGRELVVDGGASLGAS